MPPTQVHMAPTHPELCQLIEQEHIDPTKALGQSIKATVALQFVCCVVLSSID